MIEGETFIYTHLNLLLYSKSQNKTIQNNILVWHIYRIAILLYVIQPSFLLICFSGEDEAVTMIVKGNVCIYYEVHNPESCGIVQKDHIDQTVPDVTMFENKCGIYTNTRSEIVVACFCTTDKCNTIQNIQSFLPNSIASPTPLPDILSWKASTDIEQSKAFLECLRAPETNNFQ
ncbi:hypothetical protein DICVIV_09993 [Dictyocaulus viviparus]|uniref:Uncharacterized protein n=1 Tax=Dictyocaulus viviparus TaxID=29172 RepID=A0A0D8XNN6_DICVI|nr:hypothetical protein DICVIV_09993 [Dictyocaulus viviparus]